VNQDVAHVSAISIENDVPRLISLRVSSQLLITKIPLIPTESESNKEDDSMK